MSRWIEIETDALNADKNRMIDAVKEIKNELELLKEDMVTMSASWEGPASKAYQNRMAEDIENTLQVCSELSEYVECMEYAAKAYVKCERGAEDAVSRIRI